jgi:hypothetical protein
MRLQHTSIQQHSPITPLFVDWDHTKFFAVLDDQTKINHYQCTFYRICLPVFVSFREVFACLDF